MAYRYRKPLGRTEMLDAGEGVVWLLEVEWGGRTWLFSDRPLSAPDAGGQWHSMATPQVSDTISLLSTSPELMTIPIAIRFPDTIIVAQEVSRGHHLYRVKGRLSAHVVGRTFAERLVVMEGQFIEPAYDLNNQVQANLSENPFEDSAIYPTEDMRITDETWSDHEEGSTNRYYPTVFGRPGIYTASNGDLAYTSGTPAHMVDVTNRTLLIAGHSVSATTVKVLRLFEDAWEAQAYAVTEFVDALGRVVSGVVIDANGTGAADFEADAEWYIRWTGAGGLPSRHSDQGHIKGAGELIEWWLGKSTLRVDIGTVRSEGEYLDRWQLSGYVDEPVTPFDFLTRTIFPLLPVSMARTVDGFYVAATRYDATLTDAVAHLTVGQGGVNRADDGRTQYTNISSPGSYRIEFAKRADDSSYLRTKVLLGTTPSNADSRDATHNAFTRHVHALYGDLAGEKSLQTSWISLDDTAGLVLAWMSVLMGLPRRMLELSVPRDLAWLQPGKVVSVTDSERYMTSRVGHIMRAEWADNGEHRTISVMILDGPLDRPYET